jgi:restriction system protein
MAEPMQAATPPPAWGPAVLEAMSAAQFEAVCEALFAQAGFGTRCQSHGAAGGVTIWLHSRHAPQGKDSPVAVAQCKKWPHPLGVKEMHPLFELMKKRQLQRATYATSSSYTDNARKFARYNGINALDQAGLLQLIASRSTAQQQALLALALDAR